MDLVFPNSTIDKWLPAVYRPNDTSTFLSVTEEHTENFKALIFVSILDYNSFPV